MTGRSSPDAISKAPKLKTKTAGAARPDSQPVAARDRVIRVFVSSTFRDMIEDRNELMAHAWPALRKVCRGRAVEFVEVDLRWGVTEEQSRRKETLRHCLAEIKRCRPYFIGLLSERYGWMPGPDAYSPALLDEESWLRDEVAKRSVTELEILHGVLNDPKMAGRAFFYFRDPKYALARGGDYLPEEHAKPTRQDALKRQVKAVCQANLIPLREDYADPQALARLVLDDLTAAIDDEFPPDKAPEVWTREDRDHEAYARSHRTDFYVGRDAYFDRLNVLARDGAGGCGLTVLGESGGGKSALLANWVARWRQANPNDFVFQHYIGGSAMSAGHLALMRRLMAAIIRWCGAEEAPSGRDLQEERIPAAAEEIVKIFPDYLNRLTAQAKQKGVRAVLVLDALNQLEDRERGRLLGWLPYRLPGELRLIVSTLPGDTLNALQPRGWPALIVEPLTAEERVLLIARYLAHFSQELSDDRARKIAGVAAASNPLHLKTLLADLRVTGAYDRLDAQIAYYLEAADIPALFGKILARYEHDYERDQTGLVREALSLLWAAHRGLTEPELLDLLKPHGQERLPAAIWSPVRCALEDGLVDRDGVLAFAHEHLRVAVERRYVPDAGTARALRLRLADDFAGRPVDPRQADELPWLLWRAESRDRLRTCLLDIERFLEIQKREENELLGYWIYLGQERTMGRPYLESFERWAVRQDIRPSRVVYGANQLSLLFRNAGLYAEAEPLIRRALANNEQTLGPEHPIVAQSLNNLALLYKNQGQHTEAEPFYQQALMISEKALGSEHPDVAAILNNLALLYKSQGRYSEAQPLYQRTLAIWEKVLGPEHPSVATSLNSLAALYDARGQYAEAQPLYQRALAIREKVLGPQHPAVATSLNNLAALYDAKGRYAEAQPLYQRALAIWERALGPEHPAVATCLNNLAALYDAQGQYGEAQSLYQRALAIREKALGPEHPDVATSLNNLALLHDAQGQYAEARPLYQRALAIREKALGPEHPDVAQSLNNLGVLYYNQGQYAETQPLYQRALAIWEEVLGPEHPNVATCLENYALCLRALERSMEAALLEARARVIHEKHS